jgi:two-component system, sensor histidine kinase FlrB
MGSALQHGAYQIDLEDLDAPLVICAASGEVRAATPRALDLLQRVAGYRGPPAPLASELWDALAAAAPGNAVEWRPPPPAHHVLGCTRYRAGESFVVLMSELSDKHAALSRRLHRQRLESTGRLAASIAHELRNAVASIVYSADFLTMACSDLAPDKVRDTAREMLAASRRLQFTVDGLLDYARLGPTVSVPVSLREVLTRSQGLLRTVFAKGGHELSVAIDPSAEWVRGNSLSIEQILVNLMLNATEAASRPVHIAVASRIAAHPKSEALQVCITVADDGPGVPERARESIFEPFFTTREHGTGLGLPNARDAAESLGGTLQLCPRGERGACFALYLPRGDSG